MNPLIALGVFAAAAAIVTVEIMGVVADLAATFQISSMSGGMF